MTIGESCATERVERLCNRAESLENLPADSIVPRGDSNCSGRALLEAAPGSAEAVDVAIGSCSMAECGGATPDEAFDETAYLLGDPLNARRLADAIERLEGRR